jgi:creatinine amidohydrolase
VSESSTVDVLLAHRTWQEAEALADADRLVIVPAGSTEAHGPHMPLDTDTHQADTVARLLAERVSAVVAPALPYGYAEMWMGFPGTITLSPETFQTVLAEVCGSLVRGGFRRIMILNGHRPNGTSVDVAARRVVDEHGSDRPVQITALSYWEPSAAELHALRRSVVGGMGHACELETSFQLAQRPHLVHLERLEGVHTPLVGWDLVAPVEPARTYEAWPSAAEDDVAVFGDPRSASPESGEAFLEAIVTGLVRLVERLEAGEGASYGERRPQPPPAAVPTLVGPDESPRPLGPSA